MDAEVDLGDLMKEATIALHSESDWYHQITITLETRDQAEAVFDALEEIAADGR